MPDKVAHQGIVAVVATETGAKPVGAPVLASRPPIEYPSSDGKPMAESHEQRMTMTYAAQALDLHFVESDDTFVALDLLVYYEEWDSTECVAPDVMVVQGVSPRRRSSYRVWEEGKAPDFVLEVLSGSTSASDQVDKRKTYAAMGVREYFLFDPLGHAMASAPSGRRLKGERLLGGIYRDITPFPDGSIRSVVLGLDLRVKRREQGPGWRELRFRDPETGEDLPTLVEERAERIEANRQALAARSEAESEAAARREAERRIAELEAKLVQRG